MSSRRISRSDITLPLDLKKKLQLVANISWNQLLQKRKYIVLEDDDSFGENIVQIKDSNQNHFIMKSEAILNQDDWNDRCYRELLIYRALRLQLLWKSSPHFINLVDWWKSYGGPYSHDHRDKKYIKGQKASKNTQENQNDSHDESQDDDSQSTQSFEDSDSNEEIVPDNFRKLKRHNYMNLVLEKADTSLVRYLQNHDYILSPYMYKYIVFQILFALYRAQSDCQFVHNDLHLNNILLKRSPESVHYCYHVEDSTFLPGRFGKVEESELLLKITDFGNARAKLYDTGEIVYNSSLDQHSQFNAALDITKVMNDLRAVKIDWDQLSSEEAQTQKFLYQKLRSEADKIGVTPKKLLRSLFFKSFKISDAYDEAGKPSQDMIHFGDFMQPNPAPGNDFDFIGGNKEGEFHLQVLPITPSKSSQERRDTSHWKRVARLGLKSNDSHIGSVSIFHDSEIDYKVRNLNICKLFPLEKFEKIPSKNVMFVYFEPVGEKTKEKLESIYQVLEHVGMLGTTDAVDFLGYAFCLLPRYSNLARKFDFRNNQFTGAFVLLEEQVAGQNRKETSQEDSVLESPFLPFTNIPASQDQISSQSKVDSPREVPVVYDEYGHHNIKYQENWYTKQPATASLNQVYYHESSVAGIPHPLHDYHTTSKQFDTKQYLYYDNYTTSSQHTYHERALPPTEVNYPLPPSRAPIAYHSPSYREERYLNQNSYIEPSSSHRHERIISHVELERPRELSRPPRNDDIYSDSRVHRDLLDYRELDKFGEVRNRDLHEMYRGRDLTRERDPYADVEGYRNRDAYKSREIQQERDPYPDIYKNSYREKSIPIRERPDISSLPRKRSADILYHHENSKRLRLNSEYNSDPYSKYPSSYNTTNPRSYLSSDLDKDLSHRNAEVKMKGRRDKEKKKGDSKRPRKPTNTLWISLKRYQEVHPQHSYDDCMGTLLNDFGNRTLISLPRVEIGIPNYCIINFKTVNEARNAYEFVERERTQLFPNFRYTFPTKKQSMGQ